MRADFERMTEPGFREVGVSRRRYARDFVIDTLVARHAAPHDDPWETSDDCCQQRADALYLLTYIPAQGPADHAPDDPLAPRSERLSDHGSPRDAR